MAVGVGESATVSIIVAVITLVGAAVPFVATTLYNEAIHRPIINIQISPIDNNKAALEITNSGSAKATNMTLLIVPNATITSATNQFSTTEITLPDSNNTLFKMYQTLPVNSSSLKLYIKDFVNGDGSKIRLITNFNDSKRNYSFQNYYVYSSYDQGSTIGHISTAGQEFYDLGAGFLRFVRNFYNILIIYIIYFFIVIPVVNWAIRKYRRRAFASAVKYEILRASKYLGEEEERSIKLSSATWFNMAYNLKEQYGVMHTLKHYLRFGVPSRYIIDQFSSEHYNCIDEFYTELRKRENFLDGYTKSQKLYNDTKDDLTFLSNEIVNDIKSNFFKHKEVSQKLGIYISTLENLNRDRYDRRDENITTALITKLNQIADTFKKIDNIEKACDHYSEEIRKNDDLLSKGKSPKEKKKGSFFLRVPSFDELLEAGKKYRERHKGEENEQKVVDDITKNSSQKKDEYSKKFNHIQQKYEEAKRLEKEYQVAFEKLEPLKDELTEKNSSCKSKAESVIAAVTWEKYL
jgi:hypothetical protein